jgi:formate hydrogenlyase subunit 3/multisubunit Na+/H+ antiporter MnhD subunit
VLVIHFVVVFVPLLIIGAIAYAIVPAWRKKIDWAVVVLAIIAPISALIAKLSGQNLRADLIKKGYSGKPLANIDTHMGFGNMTLWFSIALGVVALVMVGYVWQTGRTAGAREHALARPASIVLTVVLGAILGYYVFRTGDSGAHNVWDGVLPPR